MRKLTAIGLLTLFLFNLWGYRFLFYYAQKQASAEMLASLDKEQYNERDLITIKIDLSMPYQSERTEFERVDGEINIDGKMYTYVKRRVYNGQLVLLCLPNHEKMKLESAREDYFKNTNGVAQNIASKQASSKTSVDKKFQSEYDYQLADFSAAISGTVKRIPHHLLVCNLLFAPHKSPEKPPEFL